MFMCHCATQNLSVEYKTDKSELNGYYPCSDSSDFQDESVSEMLNDEMS